MRKDHVWRVNQGPWLGLIALVVLSGCHSNQAPMAKADKFPAEQEVAQEIEGGMSREEVVAKMGSPAFTDAKPGGIELLYYVKPHDGAGVKTPQLRVYAGFQVVLQKNRVSEWYVTYEDELPLPPDAYRIHLVAPAKK